MEKRLKNNKGITLVALVITIIVLMIIAGVSIGASAGIKGNIKTAKNNIAITELSEVQHAILEAYIKYKQTGNDAYLVGKKLTYAQADTYLNELSTQISLKQENYDSLENISKEKYYYELSASELKSIGIQNTEDVYIANYETGEVFNYTGKTTGDGEILYIDVE